MIGILTPLKMYAQCDSDVPSFNVDLSGDPDGQWQSSSVKRKGQCCSASSSDRCIFFKVTLDTNAMGLQFDVSGGAGGTNYYIGCSTVGTAGSPQCLSGTGPFELTFCKPGNNSQTYTIQSIPKPMLLEHEVYVTLGCSVKVATQGLKTSTITWTSISGSAYNSNLSCTSNCSSTTVTPTSGFPAYVDYRVCGTPLYSCAGTSFCDTVRVYLNPSLSVSISPNTPTICFGWSGLNLTANVSGGVPPYSYLWRGSSTTQSITVGTGTWYVKVTDASGCGVARDTVTVTKFTSTITSNAGNDTTICASTNRVHLNGKVTGVSTGIWTGGTGKFISGTTSLTGTYIPSASEITAGFVYLKLTTTGNGSCSAAADSIKITIKPKPAPLISGSLNACENTDGYTYSTPLVSGDSYAWKVLGGTITGGNNTRSITVKWGSAGPGCVYVTETNASGCSETAGLSTLSLLDFNTNPLTLATTGPNGSSSDADEYSDGVGTTVNTNCGGSKGADVIVPGSTFNRGKLSVSVHFQRDENEASFIERGGLKFNMNGTLFVNYRVSDGAGGFTDIGPINTSYTVPNDDSMRILTFCYDSASGTARVYKESSLVWTNTTTANRSLYWTGAGDVKIGYVTDGNCSNKSLYDFSMVSVPVSIYTKPSAPVITGTNIVCSEEVYLYSVTPLPGHTYAWSVSGGTIIMGASNSTVSVKWGAAGTGSVSVIDTVTATGCTASANYFVTILARPPAKSIFH
jgi:hypothetical protein